MLKPELFIDLNKQLWLKPLSFLFAQHDRYGLPPFTMEDKAEC